MKSIQTHNSWRPAPPLHYRPFKSKWFVVAQLPWRQTDTVGFCLCNVCWPTCYSKPLCLKCSQLCLVSSPSISPNGMPRLDLSSAVQKAPFKLSFGGSGGVAPRHWGRAKMAAVSKGMKTVTLGYRSFHSVPCPCWALLCAHRCSHTGATALPYDKLHMPVLPHVNNDIDVWRVSFFFLQGSYILRLIFQKCNIISLRYSSTDGWYSTWKWI